MQYATQTVTVTEGDAKALGQPVGSTTTVLLTAYPSGQTVGKLERKHSLIKITLYLLLYMYNYIIQ